MKIMMIAVPNILEENSKDDNFENRMTPLDLAVLGAVLEKKHEVKILDALALRLNKKQILREVEEFNPDVVTLHAFDRCRWAIDSSIELSKNIKNKKIGLLWSYESEFLIKIMRENKNLDFAVYGDPEYTLLEVLEKNTYSGIKGTIYREEGKIIKNQPRPLINNLDKLPMPSRHLLPMRRYKRMPHEVLKRPCYDMLVSRGCPYPCIYCMVRINSGRFRRTRSPQKVYEEMNFLKQKGAKQIHFGDPTFTINKNWIFELCNIIIKNKLNLSWNCQTRTDLVDEGLLKIMKRAGCVSILYGIESLNQKILNTLKKGIRVQDIKTIIKLTKKLGIEVRCSMMIGNPGETKDEIINSVKQLIKLRPSFAQFHSVIAFPGTELFDNVDKYGRISQDKSIKKFDVNGKPFISNGFKNEDEIMKLQRESYRKFYFRPSYILKKIININDFSRNLNGFKILLKLDQ